MRQTHNIFDQLVFWLVMILAALPFGQILQLRIPGVILNAFELIWLSLLGVLLLKILLEKKIKRNFLFFIFCILALLYIFGSAAVYDVSVKDAIVQLRKYLPFMVATLLLSTGTSISTATWLNGLVICAGLSSFSALYIHYFAPSIIESSFAASEKLQEIILVYGRLYWMNASLAFFVLLGEFSKELKTKKWLLVMVSLLSFITMFNTLNRTMLVGYGLFLIWIIFISQNLRMFFRRFSAVFVILFVSFVSVVVLSSLDERVASLIQLRFFGGGDIANVYNVSFVGGRLGLYEQYAQSILQYFPLGQGLGRPFSSLLGNHVYTTDISFMSFLLPFGLMGVMVFFVFIYNIFSGIRQYGGQDNKQLRQLLFVLVCIFLLMSLNIDFFSRNNFVIFLAVMVESLPVSSHYSARTNLKKRSL